MEPTPSLALPPRTRFPGLTSAAFEHPADRAALEVLRKTPGLDRLLKWLSDNGIERYMRLAYTGDSVRISSKQCPRLYNDLLEACAILDVPEPAFYLSQNPVPNAFAFGMQNHTVVITTSLVDLMDETERLEVIGHELGHIKAEHMLYRSMAIFIKDVLQVAAGGMASIPATILSHGLLMALYTWFRKSELTADRAGLLTVQDPQICVTTLLKLVGGSRKLADVMNPVEFARQSELMEDMEEGVLALVYKLMLIRYQTHPFPTVRAKEINLWAETEEYKLILRGEYPSSKPDASTRVCPNCAVQVRNVTFRFCPECGATLGTVGG